MPRGGLAGVCVGSHTSAENCRECHDGMLEPCFSQWRQDHWGTMPLRLETRATAQDLDRAAPTKKPPSAKRHRPDVDGLRAVAVLAIIGFHLDIAGFNAGFVGVDIFFVISGYVITRGMLGDLAKGRFSLVEFYVRRARRILPALVAVLMTTLLVGIALLAPDELTELSASAFATLAFGANFFFHDRTGYFADSAHYRPLLHMWSLGVEEQFYILFPAFMTFLASRPRIDRTKTLALIAFASFIYLVIAHQMITPKNAFYMPMSRFWELAVGCGIAMAETKGWKRSKHAEWLVAVGLVGIIASVYLFDGGTMASWTVVLPVLATGMIISFGRVGADPISTLLAARPLVTIGLLSYSMYLVHWPVIVFWRMWTGRPLHPLEQAMIFFLTLLLAGLLWVLVEKPMRLGTSRIANKPALVGIVASICAVAVIGCLSYSQAEADWRLNADARSSVAELRQALAGRPSCKNDPNFLQSPAPMSAACRWSLGSGPTQFVIWGDSHAAAIAPELSRVLAGPDAAGVRIAMPDCPPLQGVRIDGRNINKGCRAFVDAVITAVNREKPKLIVVSARWANLASAVRSPGDGRPSGQIVDIATGRLMTLEDALVRTLHALEQGGSRVVLIGPVPEIEYHVPRTLVRSLRGIGELPIVTRSQFDTRQEQVMAALAGIERLGHFTVLYPHRVLCGAATCTVAEGKRPLYVDDHHLSPFGAAKVVQMLEKYGIAARH